MKVGSFEIPDHRLIPKVVADTKKIYDAMQTEGIKTSELAGVLGYKTYATGVFYRRLNAMISYGLLSKISSTSYHVTNLGMELCYPDPDQQAILTNKAVLNVELWEKFFAKFQKNPPNSGFWIQIKNLTGIDPKEAQKIENKVKKWYMEDISLVTLDQSGHPILDVEPLSEKDQNTEHLRSSQTQADQSSQQVFAPSIPETSESELIQFGKVSLSLPKKDLKKQWNKLQKYMEIYLEDYEESEQSKELVTEEVKEPTTSEDQEMNKEYGHELSL